MAIHIYNEYRDTHLFPKYVKAIYRVRQKYQKGCDHIQLQRQELQLEFNSDFDIDLKPDRINISTHQHLIAHITFVSPNLLQ